MTSVSPRPLKILLVEDDEVDVMNVQRAFQRNRMTNPMHVASNGLEALEKLRDGSIPARKLILLDLNMPRMNGIEFLRALRKEPGGDAPVVVFCTTENDLSHIIEAMNAGANEYIMKPFDGDIIEAKFSEVGLV